MWDFITKRPFTVQSGAFRKVTGMGKRVELVWPVELVDLIDAAADGRPRSVWLRRLVERELGVVPGLVMPVHVKSPAKASEVLSESAEVSWPEDRPDDFKEVGVPRCPVHGCDFTAPSVNATCRVHGRKLKL